MNLIQEIGFDNSFSFVYSQRPGTPAAELEDGTSEEEKKTRLAILQRRITQQAFDISAAMAGTVQRILVSGFSPKDPGKMQGRSENNRLVHFSTVDARLIGKFADIVITETSPNSLHGELVASELDSDFDLH